MNDVNQSRFASSATILLGAWLMLSPVWISMTGWVLASVLVVGGIMALLGLSQMFTENTTPSWIIGVSTIWLFIAAFVFDASTAVAWNLAASAVVGFFLALWDGAEIAHIHNRHVTQG